MQLTRRRRKEVVIKLEIKNKRECKLENIHS